MIAAVFALLPLGAAAASFDCAKARSASEKLICEDPHLSALDDRLAALAAAGKKRAANPRAYQRSLDNAWLVRQKCRDTACVERWYAQRIAVLGSGQNVPAHNAEQAPAQQRPPSPAALPAIVKAPASRQDNAPEMTGAKIATPPEVAAARTAPARPALPAGAPPPAPVPEASTASATGVPRTAPPPAKPVAATLPRAPKVIRPAPAVSDTAELPNVKPGAPLRVIGEELGFDIPLTRQEFLSRYDAAGAKCGVSQHIAGLKATSSSVESACWTDAGCPAPSAGLSCQVLRTGYDRSGRIVLFTTTLSASAAGRPDAARSLEKLVASFAQFSGAEVRTQDGGNGAVMSSSGARGPFKIAAQVTPAEGGKRVGTFSLATK